MKLDTHLATQNEATFSPGMRAQAACVRAKELEEAGEFEEARAALSEFWQRVGDPPRVKGLDDVARAHLYLRAGALTGWIGSARQIAGAQELAKDLISESAGAFEKLGLVERVAEARIDLAICYWREGAFDEARITLDDALLRLGNLDSEQRLRAFLNKAIVEQVSNRHREALQLHSEAAPLFEASRNHALKGKFHNSYALVLRNLGEAEHRDDYIDRALIEYAAASFHFEQARHKRFQGVVENNLGFLFFELGRLQDAHRHLDRAREMGLALKDQGIVAQVDDTRARAFIAAGEFAKAETIAQNSVSTLESGDQLSMTAEALTTYGIALARMGKVSKARASLDKAITVAHSAGDPESGGVAALTAAEELSSQLSFKELVAYYRLAETELRTSQHARIQDRLAKCARLILSNQALNGLEAPVASTAAQVSAETDQPAESQETTLEARVLRYEGELIKAALEASDGSVTRAARLLGVTHQGLAFILNGRQKSLLASRKPAKKRRRSIIRYH